MLLSLGILKRKKGFETVLFNGDSSNTTLVPNNSSCTSAQYLRSSGELVRTISAWQKKRRDQTIYLWTKVYWQVYRHMKYNFWHLLRRWDLETVCENILWTSKHCPTEFSFQNYVKTLGSNIVFWSGCIIELDLRRTTVGEELFHSEAHSESWDFAAIHGRTIIWTSSGCSNRENVGQPGRAISIPSTFKHETASYVVITRRTERFVREIHGHKNELRSNTKLLSAFQKSEVREPCVEERESNGIKETCAHPISSRYGNNEACANNFSSLPKRTSLFQKDYVNTSIPKGHKDGTSSRSRQTRTRRIISLGLREIGICWRRLLYMEHKNYQKAIGFDWLIKEVVGIELRTVWITRIPCVTFESFKDTLVVFRYVHSLQLERVHLSQRLFVGCSIYFGWWIDSGLKGKRPSPTSSLRHTFESFLWRSKWRTLHDDYTIP